VTAASTRTAPLPMSSSSNFRAELGLCMLAALAHFACNF
jgi:hypothetical protein